MKPVESPQDALRRLQGELERHRQAGGSAHCEHHASTLPGVTALLGRVPLVHGVNDQQKFQAALTDRRLRPAMTLGRSSFACEVYFGIGEVLYTSAGILYPDRRFAFILTPDIEDGRAADASPWDSGAFYKSLCAHLPAASASTERRDIFAAHTLPAPTYRTYLLDYVATHFPSGRAYLTPSEPHMYADALRALSASVFSRSFEVRVAEPIPIESWSVDMIFAPRDPGGRASLKLRKLLQPFRDRNKVKDYDEARGSLQDFARAWILDKLTRAGGKNAG